MSTQNTFQNSQQAYALSVGTTSTGGVLLFTRDPTSNDVTYKIGQQWQNTTANNLWYLNSFTASAGTVLANWTNIVAGGTSIDSIAVQTGTSPIVPDVNGQITLNGAVVAAGTNPVRTDGTGANTLAVEVQTSQAIAATNASNIGLAAFNNAHFSVDANGFVGLLGGGQAVDSFQPDTGTNPVVPSAAGLVAIRGQTTPNVSGIQVTGGTNALNIAMFSPFASAFSFLSTLTVGGSTLGTNDTMTVQGNTANTQLQILNSSTGNSLIYTAVGASPADPYFGCSESGVIRWAFGMDTSASNAFKISFNSTLGTNDVMTMTTAGLTTFTLNDVTISRAQSGGQVTLTNQNTSNSANSSVVFSQNTGGTSAGNNVINLTNTTDTSWSMYMTSATNSALTFSAGNPGTNNTLIMSYAGEVTMPLQPSFIATHSIAQNNITGAGANATINFTSVVANRGSDYDGTNTFTAPVTGLYRFSATVYLDNLSVGMTLGFISLVTTARSYINYYNPGGSMTSANSLSLSITTLADMTAGNTCSVAVQVSNGAGNTAGVPADVTLTFFSGELVV